jgi:c-di-AMP phosphodiesterase-like protein
MIIRHCTDDIGFEVENGIFNKYSIGNEIQNTFNVTVKCYNCGKIMKFNEYNRPKWVTKYIEQAFGEETSLT